MRKLSRQLRRDGHVARMGELWGRRFARPAGRRERPRRRVRLTHAHVPVSSLISPVCSYAAIGAVLISKRVADGVRDASGFWKHGHTYQANPLSCAAALAVQKVVAGENLLKNVTEVVGPLLGSLLREKLQGPNALAAPFVFDIRGGGAWYGIEWDFSSPAGANLDFGGEGFALAVQARALANGLAIMGFAGGASLDGLKGHHSMLSPAYNVTPTEIETIVDLFVRSVEEVLKAGGLQA